MSAHLQTDQQFNLLVYQGYQQYEEQFEALKLWIENTFKELCFHEKFLYAVSVRIKQPDSLIEKVRDNCKGDFSRYRKFEDVLAEINDVVGARIIAYEPGGILAAHSFATTSDRFRIKKIRFHKFGAASIPVLDDIAENCPITPEIEINENGYMGVHYIMNAHPVDSFYHDPDNPSLYPKFELQARTLIAHAWSEIQHRMVYKEEGTSRPAYDTLVLRFGDLANHFVAADNTLWRLTSDNVQHIRTLQAPVQHPAAFIEFVTDISKCVNELDANSTAATVRRKICDTFISRHKDTIDALVSKGEHCSILVELAEVFAKGNRHTEARHIYENCAGKNYDADGWVYLRLAEVYDALGLNEKALECLGALEKTIATRSKTLVNDHMLFMGAGVTAWQYNEKEQAAVFGKASVRALPDDAPPNDQVTVLSNNVYYAIELLEQQLDNGEVSEEKAFRELLALKSDIDRVIELDNNGGNEQIFRASLYDNIGWYFFKLASNAPIEDLKKEYVNLAKQYLDKCHNQWEKYESAHTERHETWRSHARSIRSLFNRLNSHVAAKNTAIDAEVFISYAWKADTDIVDKLCATLRDRGISIKRDKDDLKYKDSIADFMKSIGDGKAVVVILSDAYLRSGPCLFELVHLSRHPDFLDRIFPIVLDDASIYDPVELLQYVKYWEQKIAELDKGMKQVEASNLQGIREKLDHYRDIRSTIAKITDVLNKMNNSTTQNHVDSGFSELVDAITLRIES